MLTGGAGARRLEANRTLGQKIEAAVGAAYAGIANVDEILVLINRYPLRNVGWRHTLQSVKPEIVEGLAQLNGERDATAAAT